jgi:hypothetical protein
MRVERRDLEIARPDRSRAPWTARVRAKGSGLVMARIVRATRVAVVMGLLTFAASPLFAQSTNSLGPGPYVAFALGSYADTHSTVSCIRTGTCREAMPMLFGKSPNGVIASKSLATGLMLVAMRSYERAGHPKLAKWIGYGGGIGMALIAARNVHVSGRRN